jgi:hypothetical protein
VARKSLLSYEESAATAAHREVLSRQAAVAEILFASRKRRMKGPAYRRVGAWLVCYKKLFRKERVVMSIWMTGYVSKLEGKLQFSVFRFQFSDNCLPVFCLQAGRF